MKVMVRFAPWFGPEVTGLTCQPGGSSFCASASAIFKATSVRVARALGTLPRLSAALACGELSYSKVRALTRVATPETEERLLAVGRAGTAEHVEVIVRG